MKSSSLKIPAHKYIALWMTLEGNNGDSDIAYRIALTVPDCCKYLDEQERYVALLDSGGTNRLLNTVRSTLYVKASRSMQLGESVI